MHFSLPLVTLNVAFAYGGLLKRANTGHCNEKGLQYAAFDNPFQRDDDDYTSFDPTYMKAQSAGGQGPSNVYYNSTTSAVGGFTSQGLPAGADSIQIYGNSYKIPLWQFAVNHRGYLKALETGTYTFAFSNVDDIFYVWTGATALKGWTAANADKMAYYTSENGDGSATVSYDMEAGQYLPIRIIYANGGGPFSFTLTGTAPNGKKFLTGSTPPNPHVVTYSCAKRKVPAFPYEFGEEQ